MAVHLSCSVLTKTAQHIADIALIHANDEVVVVIVGTSDLCDYASAKVLKPTDIRKSLGYYCLENRHRSS